jgi:hypothetical protein
MSDAKYSVLDVHQATIWGRLFSVLTGRGSRDFSSGITATGRPGASMQDFLVGRANALGLRCEWELCWPISRSSRRTC